MDFGQYGAAEASYRKALHFDVDFILGKSVLARLTLDLEERLALYNSLKPHRQVLHPDEAHIFEVYKALTHFTNIRATAPKKVETTLDSVLIFAEKTLRKVVHKYPDEVYLKSEYMEVLHSRYGPHNTLDSIHTLVRTHQKDNPFLLGYTAELYAEIGNYKIALEKAKQLLQLPLLRKTPKPAAVLAQVYFAMDSIEQAKKWVDKAYSLDARNLDASRLKIKIDQKLGKIKEK